MSCSWRAASRLEAALQIVLEGQLALHLLHGLPVGLILGGLSLSFSLKPLLMLIVEDGETGHHQHHGSDQSQPIFVLPIVATVIVGKLILGMFHTSL